MTSAAMEPRQWGRLRQTIFSVGTYVSGRPVAMFDFDSTLQPYRKKGPEERLTLCFLAELSSSFNLVIVSNRNGDTAQALAPLKTYVAALDQVSRGRITVYAPTARDRDRKPHTGTWEHYLETLCGGVRPRFVFFCGDAAGRPGDHSATDYAYALNIGVTFTTPEALFFSDNAWLDPAAYGCCAPIPPEVMKRDIADSPLPSLVDVRQPLVVIMIGSPASGKSFVSRGLARSLGVDAGGHGVAAVVGNDKQGTRHRAIFDTELRAGHNIIVDNTSPLKADRAFYAERARARGHSVVLCYLTTSKPACFHLNAARCQMDTTGSTKALAPVVLHTYWKRLEVPTQEEAETLGAQLVVVPFWPSLTAPPEITDFHYPLA